MCKQAYKDLAIDLSMDLFQEAKEKGYTEEILAEKIGASPYSILDYRYGKTAPSLAVFVGGFIAIKPEKVLKRFANWSGYVVIKLPEVKAPFTFLTSQTSKVMRETADVIEAVGKALEDGELSEREILTVEKEIDEAIEELLKLKHSLRGRK